MRLERREKIFFSRLLRPERGYGRLKLARFVQKLSLGRLAVLCHKVTNLALLLCEIADGLFTFLAKFIKLVLQTLYLLQQKIFKEPFKDIFQLTLNKGLFIM